MLNLLEIVVTTHSFWRLIWRLFKTLLLRGAPSPVTVKEERLEGDVKFGRGGHQQGTQLNREIIPGRWAHNRKGLRSNIAKRARGTKNSPLTAERSTRCAAKTDTGQQIS